MDAIDTLMSEHRLIESALDALEAYVDGLAGGTDGRPADLGELVMFIREFADRKHHGKEEEILFAAMVEAGFPRKGGPIAVMLSDHEQGRAYVRIMAEAAAKNEWSAASRRQVREAALAYTQLLRSHILKEDQILYPMARARLPAEVMAEVDLRVSAFEEQEQKNGADLRLRVLAASLARRHPPRAA